MIKQRPLISVAIPTYNRESVLVDTIRDILSQSFKKLELIVVDQTPIHEDLTITMLKSIRDARFRYFKITPPSVTVARNFALTKAISPFIVFLDDDIKPDKDLVKTFFETFKGNPHMSAIAGRVLQKGFPVLPILEFDSYGTSHGGYTGEEPGLTNAFPGGNCALVVKDALAAGGFDTRYRGNAFREENDLSIRMAKRGQRIYYQPRATILHLAVPYGGNRIKTHIYDNPGFYANELLFTLRAVPPSRLPRALFRKYKEYCCSVSGYRSVRRGALFWVGLVRACYRIVFVSQTTAKEI